MQPPTFAHTQTADNAQFVAAFAKLQIAPTVYEHTAFIKNCVAAAKQEKSNEKVTQALHHLRAMPSVGVQPNDFTYNTVLDGLCELRRMREAEVLLMEMDTNKVPRTAVTYTTLIKGYCNVEEFGLAKKTFAQLKQSGLPLSDYPYSTLVKGYCKKGRLEEAEVVFEEMLQDKVAPKNQIFASLIQGCVARGQMSKAERYFRVMTEHNCAPNVFTYGSLIKGYTDTRQMQRAEDLLAEMKQAKVERNQYIYNMLIHGYCMGKDPEKGVDVIRRMKEDGIALSTTTYTIIIKGFRCTKQPERAAQYERELQGSGLDVSEHVVSVELDGLCRAGKLQEALKKFRANAAPGSILYSVFLRAYCARGRLEKAEALFQEMRDAHLLNIYPFNIMIKHCLDAKLLDKVFAYYEELLRLEIDPDKITFSYLMDANMHAGRYTEVETLFEQLQSANVPINDVHYSRLLQAMIGQERIGEAQERLRVMPKSIVSAYPYNIMLKAHIDRGQYQEAERLYGIMTKTRKVPPSDHTLNAMLECAFKQNDEAKAAGYFEQMTAQGVVPNIVTYTLQIRHHAEKQQMDQAEALFREMQRNKIEPDEVLYCTMIKGFAESGDHKKAEEMSALMAKRSVPMTSSARFNILLKTFAEAKEFTKAATYFWKILEAGYEPDECYYTQLIEHYGQLEDVDSARKIYDRLLKQNAARTDFPFAAMISVHLRQGNIRLAKEVLGQARARNIQPSQALYCMFIQGYFRLNSLDGVVSMYKTMGQEGIQPDAITYNSMIQGFYNAGRIDEARALFAKSGLRLHETETGLLDCHGLEHVVAYWAAVPHLQSLPKDETHYLLTGIGKHSETHERFAMQDFIQEQIAKDFPHLESRMHTTNRGVLLVQHKAVAEEPQAAPPPTDRCLIS